MIVCSILLNFLAFYILVQLSVLLVMCVEFSNNQCVRLCHITKKINFDEIHLQKYILKLQFKERKVLAAQKHENQSLCQNNEVKDFREKEKKRAANPHRTEETATG